MKLQMNIEDFINQNASEFEASKIIKKQIKDYIRALPEIFEKDQGKNFLVQHTKNIDIIITSVYKYILRTHFYDYIPMINTIPITIIAMGSYGREQLCVYSDIDLLIVYKEVPAFNLVPIIESMLQVLWDSGLKLGHRVHEIGTLIESANSDHTIKTAFLESRFIHGSKYLWMETEQILNKIRQHEPRKFILEKLDERQKNRQKFPLNMQPDIKSSPGGFRDANTLFWILKTLYNTGKIRDACPTHISTQEYSELMMSLEFLYRLRSALHLSSGKKSDKLILELIPDVSEKLHLDQTKTVKKTFEAMHHIDTICGIVVKRVTNSIFFKAENITLLHAARVEKNIYFYNNKLYTSMHIKQNNLLSILKQLATYANYEIEFDISYIQYLKNANIDKENTQESLDVIKSIFYTQYPGRIFLALYQAHQLNHVIPVLQKVAYLPQFDGYHTQPVDIHSIYTLKAFEAISDIHVKDIYEHLSIENQALIRLIAFLHDCGKGRKTDHSILGANIVKNYILKLGFSQKQAKQAYILIRYHTLMSNTAHREDIYSEKVIYSFILKLQNPKILKLLYVLTYADISSVSKTTYSPNNAKLLYALYRYSLEAFANKTVLNEAAKRQKKEQILIKIPEFSILSKTIQKKTLQIESNLLFLKFTPDEIIDITSWIAIFTNNKNNFEYKIQNKPYLRIDIIRKESVNVGYILSKLSNINVVNMDIYKIFDGIKFFRIDFEEAIEDDEIIFIKHILDDALSFNKEGKLKAINIKRSNIHIDCNHSKTYAKMKLQTEDQKGLVANIMTVFDDIGIDIASAKIQTIKNKARNLFLIEKNGNFCTNQEIVINRLINKN